MKRRFALPLAIVLAGEFVLLVCLNHKAIAVTVPTPVVLDPGPPPLPEPPDEVMPSDDPGGAPSKPRPDLPSPLEARRDPDAPRIPLELSLNPIAPPQNAIIVPGELPPPHTTGPEKGNGLFGAAQLDNAPRARVQQPPAYPYQAKADSLSGEVVVEFTVDYNGRVMNAHVVSSTNPVFEESTLRAISQWRFEPGRRNGTIVRFRMRMPVEFHLESN